MKVYLSTRKKPYNWHDVTEYIKGNIAGIEDVADGKMDTCSFSLRLSSNVGEFNYKKAIPPKNLIKISFANGVENERNTFYFLTEDNKDGRLRQVGTDVDELYEHQILGREYFAITEDTPLTNYTITQPKSEFFNRYNYYGFYKYRLNQPESLDGYLPNQRFNSGSVVDNNMSNVNGKFEFFYDNGYGRGIKINNIYEVGYDLSILLDFQATAKTFIKYRVGGFLWETRRDIYPKFGTWGRENADLFNIKVLTIYYDSNNNIINSNTQSFGALYEGGEVGVESSQITSLGAIVTKQVNIHITKNTNAYYSRVYVYYEKIKSFTNYSSQDITDFEGMLKTNISGFANDSNVKVNFNSLQIVAQSGTIKDPISVVKQTYYDFLTKVLYDYNLNKRPENQITLDTALETVLSIEAKEGEYNEYNFRELIERVFKYVGIVPYLTIDNVLTYLKPTKESIYLDLEETQELNSQFIDEDYYDTITSTTKNLVSDKDFAKELLAVTSLNEEFSQVTSESAGFKTSQDIYYIVNAYLEVPSIINFNINKGGATHTIKSNTDTDYLWDITSRFLEKDIFEALPNVRYDDLDGRKGGFLGKGNTIYFKSGSNEIGNLGNLAPDIPSFNLLSGSIPNVALYSVVEMLMCLAFEYADNNIAGEWGNNNTSRVIDDENDFAYLFTDTKLHITYIPINKEIMTKHITNKQDRKGLNWGKRVNINNRLISYEDSAEIMKNEMEKKGNEKLFVSQTYNDILETIPTLSIINDNYVVSSRRITATDNIITCEYTLDKDILNQNDDIGLAVNYDVFTVPYEYVVRDILINNYVMFFDNENDLLEYRDDEGFMTVNFLNSVFKNDNLKGELYAKFYMKYQEQANNNAFMRLNVLNAPFTMLINGKFEDNYSAGNQLYMYVDEIYSIPYRYCDYDGKVKEINRLEVGFSGGYKGRLRDKDNFIDYDLKLFPQGDKGEITTVLNETNIPLGLLKDGREAYQLNIHNFLTQTSERIKFYNFKKITHAYILTDDIPLTDDLTWEKVFPYAVSRSQVDLDVFHESNHDYIEIDNAYYDVNDYGKPLILVNETENITTLVGIVKTPKVIAGIVDIHVKQSRYGMK